MASVVFSITATLFVLADIAIMALSIRQKSYEGYFLAATMGFASVVDIGYAASVTSIDYFAMSFSSSIYFAGVSLSVYCFLLYLFTYCDLWDKKAARFIMAAFLVLVLIDLSFLMINPFNEITLHYIYEPDSLAHWRYSSLPPYDYHLILCYVMVGAAFFALAYKCVGTSRVYRQRYYGIIALLAFIVFVNGLFLYLPRSLILDYSLIFYSVMGLMIYFMHFRNAGQNVLSATRQLILDQLGRAVILFDDRGAFATCNLEAQKIIPTEKRTKNYRIENLLEDLGIADRIDTIDSDVSFRQRLLINGELRPYRFDHNVLRDKKGVALGRLVVLGDNSSEFDFLTGFHTKVTFERDYYQKNPAEITYPASVCVCDLNRLANINAALGRERGNEAIKRLSDLMTQILPEGTYLVKHDDANLLAVCEGYDRQTISKKLDEVKAVLQQEPFDGRMLDIKYAISVATSIMPDIAEASDIAIAALRARKMLDFKSAHSSLLASMATILRQTDNETEEHVMRTRIVAEHLGKRLGLSDWQQSCLALLCLLHDIGKVGIPLEILFKPGKLTDAEWEEMKSHAYKGYEICAASEELRPIANYVLHHHEAWDGSGYPDGLSRESIPLLSRILAIVDTYDAMTHDRPYRPALSQSDAISELRRCSGTQFDPTIVAEFIRMIQRDNIELQNDLYSAGLENSSLKTSENGIGEGAQDTSSPLVPAGAANFANKVQSRITPEWKIAKVRYARYVLNSDQRIVEVHGSFEEMTGYSKQDVEDYKLGHNDLLFPEDWDVYWELASKQLESNQEAYIDHRIRRKDGSSLTVFCFGRRFYDTTNRDHRSEILIADLNSARSMQNALKSVHTVAQKNQKKWEERARKDPATDLLNREAFRADVQTMMMQPNRVTVMAMIDIDYFKQFNDEYGHAKGDELVTCISNALKDAIEEDGLACRMGGDEFAAVISLESGYSVDQIRHRAEQLHERVLNKMQAYNKDATISMGVAKVEAKDATFMDLYDAADQALYKVKRAGRRNLYCDL